MQKSFSLVCLSVSQSVSQSVCLSVSQSVRLFVCLSVSMYVCTTCVSFTFILANRLPRAFQSGRLPVPRQRYAYTGWGA